jgi:streptogramin lyase
MRLDFTETWLAALLLSVPVSMPAQQVAIIEHPLPSAESRPHRITAGPDGALWFTESNGNKIGRMATAGVVTEVPTRTIGPFGITVGPDGALWFTEYGGNKIGQVVFVTAVLTASPDSGFPGANVTLSGSGFSAGESVNLYAQQHGFQSAVHGHR